MSVFDSILHCCCEAPHIPPCQCNPYYDDPRDFHPISEGWTADIAKAMGDHAKQRSAFDTFVSSPFHQYFNEGYQCGWDVSSQNDKSVEVEMIQCQQCGTYFPKRTFTPFGLNVCDECLRKSQEDYRNRQD